MTTVFTALALASFLQEAMRFSLKKIITKLRPLREVVGEINGYEIVFSPDALPDAA